MKICIPSKDRAHSIITPFLFDPKDVLIFVEPQEVKRYQIFLPDYKIIDIKKSNQGISYVRNFILDFVNDDKIIMADDDIDSIGIRNDAYRYDSTNDLSECLNDIEVGLDTYWCYVLTYSPYSYFINKACNNSMRFQINTKHAGIFFGIKLKEIKKYNIKFDSTLDIDDIDFSMQVFINGGCICSDLKYAISAQHISSGGLESIRKLDGLSLDKTSRRAILQLSKKYGPEFVKFTHDTDGYAHSCSINVDMLLKRKEIAKKSMQQYYQENGK